VRKLGCLGIVLALVLALGGVLDVFAKGFTEEEIAAAVEHRSNDRVGTAKVTISSFPYLGKLVGFGDIDHIDIAMSGLNVTQPVDEVAVHIDGLHMDRDALLGESHVQIKKVDRVSVAVFIASRRIQTLADAIGLSLAFEDGGVRLAGERLDVAAANGLLTVSGAGLTPLSVPIPAGDPEVLPCQPGVEVRKDGIRLSCATDKIPKILLDAIGSPTLRQLMGS
jgi:hypothetical protein